VFLKGKGFRNEAEAMFGKFSIVCSHRFVSYDKIETFWRWLSVFLWCIYWL